MDDRPIDTALRTCAREFRSSELRPEDSEKAVWLSRERFRATFSRTGIGMATIDLEGRVVDTNDALPEMLGYRREELTAMAFSDFTHPEDVEADWELFRTLFTGERDVYHLEKRYIRKDGRILWGRLTASIVCDNRNRPQFGIGMLEDITEQKRAEESLRESERKFRSIFDNAGDAIFIHDMSGRFVEVNQVACNRLGYSREELLQMSPMDIDTAEYAARVADQIRAIDRHGQLVFESAHRRKDGTVFPVEINSRQITFERRNCILSVVRDITERRQAEEKLRAKEDLLRTIVDAIPAPVFYKNVQGAYIGCNQAFCDLFNLPKAEILGKTILDLASKDQARRYYEADLELLKTGNTQIYEADVVTADGSRRQAIFHKAPLRGPNREIIGIVGAMLDITERKLAEQALAERERYLSTILQTTADGFWVVDLNGIIVQVNDAASTMTGYPRDELLHRQIGDIDAVDEPAAVAARIARILASGSELFETRVRRKDGRVIDVEVSATYLDTDGGKLVCFCRDITARKAAEAEKGKLQARLQQAQKMESIGSLAGGIAHDFNNMLFPIIGMAELLLDDLPPDSPEAESVREIHTTGKRCGELVKQILAFSRQSEEVMIPVRVQKVLAEALKLTRATIPSSIEIRRNVQKDCGMVLADPTQLHQVVMNLITNAYHAVEPEGGTISVDLRESELGGADAAAGGFEPGRYARLAVSDTGCGIDPAIVDRIFDPYFTTKPQGKGTGLGLAVVYGIVKECRGDVKVYSEPGEGTSFTVYLPLLKNSPEPLALKSSEKLPRGNERILVVDDEESIVRLQTQMLERLGYRVTSRVNSVEALAAYKADPEAFDLVITDMTMPNMTGDRLARELIAMRPGLPIILCTGFSERIDSEKAAAMGTRGFLMKPVVRAEMAQMVRRVLDQVRRDPLSS